MNRIKPETKSQVPENLKPSAHGGNNGNHDKVGKFTKGNLASIGNRGNAKEARQLTQMLISCLNEEVAEYVKDAKGNKTKTKTHVVRMRKTIEALWQLSVGWNGEKPDLAAIIYLFDRVDGPLPKSTATEDVIGDRTIQFTLKVSNPNAERDASDLRTTYDGPTIDGTLNGPNPNGSQNGHG